MTNKEIIEEIDIVTAMYDDIKMMCLVEDMFPSINLYVEIRQYIQHIEDVTSDFCSEVANS